MTSNPLRTLVALVSLSAALVFAPAQASNNPMDHVGKGHNLYLDCLRASKNQDQPQLQRLVTECGVETEMSPEDFAKKHQFILEIDPLLSVAQRMQPYRESYSEREFAYFHAIDEIFRSAQSPADLDAKFARLEAQAVAELDPKTKSGATILSGLSIARHSLAYWTEGAGSASNVAARGFWGWLWRKCVTIAADIVAGMVATELGLGVLAQPLSSGASDVVERWIE